MSSGCSIQSQRCPLGQTEAQERDQRRPYLQVGDPGHLKVFANQDAAETWFEENDPEGVAFEYEILE